MSQRGRSGALVVVLLSGWVLVTGLPRSPASTLPAVMVVLAAAAIWALVRRSGPGTWFPVVVGTAVLAAVLLRPAALSGGAGAPPLGYGNANGALLVVGTGGFVLAALHDRRTRVRAGLGALSLLGAVLTWLTGSAAGGVLATAVLASLVLARRRRAGRVLAAAALLAPVAATAVTVAEATGGPHLLPRPVVSALSVRPELWADALRLVGSAPLTGIGPGGVAAEALRSGQDTDLRWSHSLLLQQAAETGLVGAALLALLLAWGGLVLWRSARDRPEARAGAVLAGGLLTQAAIDYTAHFPAVVLGCVALVAWACAHTASGPPSERDVAVRPASGRGAPEPRGDLHA